MKADRRGAEACRLRDRDVRWPFDARKGGNALENLTFASFEEFAAQRERLRDLFRRDAPEEAPILFLR
jgi:hypothetical protein